MQIFSLGDSFHEQVKPNIWEKLENYFQMPSAEIFTKHAEC